MTGLLGGAFDPPHNGHLALAQAALAQLPIERLAVLVSQRPGHKRVDTDAPTRLRLAHAAFDGLARTSVELDPYPYTVELLRTGRFPDPVVVIGADQWEAFGTWKEPEELLRLARFAVVARAGHEPPGVDGDRVCVLPFDSPPISSSDVRARVARGEPVDALVPPLVAALIRSLGLYRAG